MKLSDEEAENVRQRIVAPRHEDAEKFLATPFPSAFALGRAVEFSLWDELGGKYLDFTSGEGLAPLGHLNPAITAAVTESRRLYDTGGAYGRFLVGMQVDYAKMVSFLFSPDPQNHPHKVAFAVTGEEAFALALRLAFDRTDRPGLAGIDGNSYLPVGTQTVAEHERPEGDFWSDKAALLVEVLHFDSGCHTVDRQWLQALVADARHHDVPVIVDERWTGYGRLGLVAGQFVWEVEADLTVLGGPGGGGFPFGAVVADPSWFDRPWSVSPISGNPSIMAAGMAVAAHINAPLLHHVRTLGETVLPDTLSEMCAQFPQYLRSYQGAGMLWGLTTPDPDTAMELVRRCVSRGLLVSPTPRRPDCLRLAPPLLSSADFIRTALDALADACLD